jgi:ubiquinone/menaquinone biosynthesis C-methylase UbiE
MTSDGGFVHDHDAVVRRSFERQVGLFSGPGSPFAQRDTGTLAWLEPLTPDMLVLDAACGAAHAAEVVAPHVRQVVGVDLTRALLDLGASRLRERGIGNVLLQEGNAQSLPFVDGSFDLAFCRAALHHMADPQRTVDELVRVIAPAGRVVLFDLVSPIPEARDTFDRVHRLIDPSHVRAFTEAELPQLFPDGFELTYGATSTIRMPVDVSLTEQSARDEVLDALRADIAGGEPTGFEPAEEDGTITVAFTTTVVHGARS